MPADRRRPVARAIAIAAAENHRRRAIRLAFNCAAASMLLAVLAVAVI
ncbi:hypothetical protein [Mycoplana ramosa]|uniref:Uncharacterized protein n=1 Tax=Mycoplana ramosa TaxID=40837 RepID=A0ABW3YWY8_MYCRA